MLEEKNTSEKDEKELETIVMADEDGTEIEFTVIDGAEINKIRYLLVVKTDDYDREEPEAYIIKEVDDDGESIAFEFVCDDNEYAQAAIALSSDDNDYEMIF